MLQEYQNQIVIYYLAGTFFVIILVLAIFIFVSLHQKKVNKYRLKLQNDEIKYQQAIFLALQEGEEKERERLAAELHDGIGAKLTGLKMNLEYLTSNSIESEHYNLISKTYKTLTTLVEELREISHNLIPSFSTEIGLEKSLLDYMDQLGSMTDCKYNLIYDNPLKRINVDGGLEFQSYRIITELLHNIHKHANASKAVVQITFEEFMLELIIEDNGIGFDPNSTFTKGIGLINVKNRIKACKGQINIDSSNYGTVIIINLPLTKEL